MKKLLLSILFAATCAAQTPAPLTTIKGNLIIKFDTRQKPGVENVTDKYTLNLTINNFVILKGDIEHRPFISSTFSANQNAQLNYDVSTNLINPKKPTDDPVNVGKVLGIVPISENNVYDYSVGSAKINVFPTGSASGFESKFNGQALGKPPAKTGFAALKQDALKLVNGKGAAISVTKYDKMEFVNLTLPTGPAGVYSEVTVSGVMLYDYVRSAWYFQNVIVTYGLNGQRMQDNITGNIRWGAGAYVFDIRVNEPPPSETAAFAAVADESAFFATDDVNPSLTGTAKYKDSTVQDRVIASSVAVDLTGNKLTKQQTMYLAKLIFLVAVVPFNAE